MRIRYFLKIITFIGVLVLFTNCYSKTDCKLFKNGKFKIIDENSNNESIIERNDSIQIEKNLTTGDVSEYIVNWTNDCEYTLKIIKGSKETLSILKDKLLFVKILSVESGAYKFQVEIEGIDYVGIHKMIKIQ